MGSDYIERIENTGGYLVSCGVASDFSEDWFSPEFWGEKAVAVTKGGRGAAWFVDASCGELVLRHFCRGGLPGRFIRRSYIFTRSDAVRSFAEFRLLKTLIEKEMPVPEPVAAGYCLHGPLFYHAALIIRRIPDARPLTDFTDASSESTWRDAGACVRRFHDAGVFHADLNCMNILVSDQVYLIDFDRGRIMPGKTSDSWKQNNIQRLERSVSKCLTYLDEKARARLWQSLLEGYAGA